MVRCTVLNVAEKPSVARELTRFLCNGRSSRIPSKSKYNPIDEFSNTLNGVECTMYVTSVRGHLMGLDFPARYAKWHSVSDVELFDAPVEKKVSEGNEDVVENLRQLARKSTVVALWLDCDREGENISFEVVEVCAAVKSSLSFRRAKFSALTQSDVTRAWRNLQEPDELQAHAVDCRQELDLRTGAAFTRLLTKRLSNSYANLPAKLVSYGPCQFPTLGLVVARWEEVMAFQPALFWALALVLPHPPEESSDPGRDRGERGGERGGVSFTWDRGRLFNRQVVASILYRLLSDETGVITECKGSAVTKWRPVPLSTVELTKLSANILRMDSSKAMHVAESLYQQGLISYPRTETTVFAPTIDQLSLVQIQAASSEWGGYVGQLLDGRFQKCRNGNKDDKAHPPIHPLKWLPRESHKDQDHWRLYELISRHFLACCSPDARGVRSNVRYEIGGETFSASGLIVIDRGWLNVYPYEKWNANSLPKYTPGSRIVPTSLTMTEGKTTPPPLLSEADLITRMDHFGIGTDATMHEHIKTVQERKYCIKNSAGLFSPCPIGIALVRGVSSMRLAINLSEPSLRSKVESSIARVANGSLSKSEFMREHVSIMRRLFVEFASSLTRLEAQMTLYFLPKNALFAEAPIVIRNLVPCGRCNGSLDLRRSTSTINENIEFSTPASLRLVCNGSCVSPSPHSAPPPSHPSLPSPPIPRTGPTPLSLPVPLGDLASWRGERCPVCNFGVLAVVRRSSFINQTTSTNQSQNNRPFPVCSYCYSHPPSPGDGGPDIEDLVERFSCHQCKNTRCQVNSFINANR